MWGIYSAMVKSLICTILFTACPAFALTLPPTTSLSTTQNGTNSLIQALTSGGGGKAIDGRFWVLFARGSDDLAEKPVYMSVLRALKIMSHHDYNFKCPVGRNRMSFREYPDIEILIEPNPFSTVEFQWRHAMWGLYRAVIQFHDSDFLNTVARLMWHTPSGEVELGHISIQKSSPTSMSPSASLAYPQTGTNWTQSLNTSLTQDEDTVASGNTITALSSTRKVSLAIDVTGGRITKWGVFFTVYAAIVTLASFDQQQQVADLGFNTAEKESRARLHLEPIQPHRTAPPYLLPRAAIDGLSLIPKYMYQKNKFNEVRFVVKLNDPDLPLGYGYIRKVV